MGKRRSKRSKRKQKIRSEIRSEQIIEEAAFDSSEAKETKILGFACPDCSDFEMALAEKALDCYQQKKQDALGFEVAHVVGAYFEYSTSKAAYGDCEDRCHISFCAEAQDNSLPKMWLFAEVKESPIGYFAPSRVEILNPSGDDLKYGCEFCPPHALFPHPRGFQPSYGPGDGAVDATVFCHYHKCEDGKEEKPNEWSVKCVQMHEPETLGRKV